MHCTPCSNEFCTTTVTANRRLHLSGNYLFLAQPYRTLEAEKVPLIMNLVRARGLVQAPLCSW